MKKMLFHAQNGNGKHGINFDKDIIGQRHYNLIQRCLSALVRYEELEEILNKVQKGDFVYFDPPYRPLPNTPSFTAYSKDGFNDEQQKRLAAFCRKLDADGHQWLLSNSDPANTDPADRFFEAAFAGFEIRRVYASRMINSKVDGRGKITELAIRNYKG